MDGPVPADAWVSLRRRDGTEGRLHVAEHVTLPGRPWEGLTLCGLASWRHAFSRGRGSGRWPECANCLTVWRTLRRNPIRRDHDVRRAATPPGNYTLYTSGTEAWVTDQYGRIWGHWNSGYMAATGSSTSSTLYAAANNTWEHWIAAGSTTTTYQYTYQTNVGAAQWAPAETPAQRAERERLAAQYRAERDHLAREAGERAREQREAIRGRASALLIAHLTETERAEFEEHGHFHIHAPSGRRYRIRRQVSGNLDQYADDGLTICAVLCVHPYEGCPAEDVMLAQKLWLLTDERMVLGRANTMQGQIRRPGDPARIITPSPEVRPELWIDPAEEDRIDADFVEVAA